MPEAAAKKMSEKKSYYPTPEPNPDFAKIEEKVLAYWKQDETFRKSVEQCPAEKEARSGDRASREPAKQRSMEFSGENSGNNEYVFYDGPPFANGLPHYGHLLTGYVKDLYARYHTMKGERVERRFGWDCHGLPAEMGAEKGLGISGRKAIEDYGIGKFNDYCRSSVMKYAHEWEHYVDRQARWVDFKNDYKTMDKNFMESVLWAFKQLYDKGLIYESHRVMPYSWAAETPLSNFETKLDNSYRPRTDKAVTVKFKLDADEVRRKIPNLKIEGIKDYYLLAWTTTPWTLPSNLALAVREDMVYMPVTKDKNCYILAISAVSKYLPDLGYKDVEFFSTNVDEIREYSAKASPSEKEAEIIDECKNKRFNGARLIGLSYKPLFPYFQGIPKAFRVLNGSIDGSSFITEGDGTGIVHMAPGFGEDDQKVCAANGIEVVVPVDESGRYTDEIFDLPHPLPTLSPSGGEGGEAGRAGEGGLLETAHLYACPFTEADYPLYQQMQADPKVAATTSDGVLPEAKIRAEFERLLRDQTAKGFTQWAIFRKEDDAFIGRGGLDNRDYDQFNTSGKKGVELRYALMGDYWGKGYATELAVALLDWAMEHIKPEIFIAGCNPTYEPAIKLLKKLGFTAHHHVPFRDQTVWYHTLEPEHWAKHRASLVMPPLSLKGLNVVADTRKAEDEPYKPEQLAKYGLANLRIVKWLKDSGKLVKEEDYTHNYPHCWRTDTPLIYRALPSWYVAVTKFRDRAVELNQQINWIPEHIRDGQMGHMLATAPDWSISRNRFWGTPIPIWRRKNQESGIKNQEEEIKVFGSIAELEDFFGVEVKDLHRPFIDQLTLAKDGSEWQRVTDVFDCWFESGSMPFAQVHYPFENKEWFETHFPADFITEYVGQTRGWFNTLIILATALFDKPPFKNCICHGVVLDAETGLKYSKRLKNYKDPLEVIDQYGADALRWLMISSPVMRGQDLMVDPEGKFIRDVVRLHIKPIWNAYNFFTLYANADGVKAKSLVASRQSLEIASDQRLETSDLHLMDRYILAKCREAVVAIEKGLDAYDTPTACQAVSDFFEVLNNWYIRRNKDRFWNETGADTDQAAYDTLYTVLVTMCRAAAPLLPMTLEEIYRGLTGEESVHLAGFPEVAEDEDKVATYNLIFGMDWTRDACNAALAIRNKVNIRVRQPLGQMLIVGKEIQVHIAEFDAEPIIKDEVNVKEIKVEQDISKYADFHLEINSSVLGKNRPEKMKQIIPASKKGEWESLPDGRVKVAEEVLELGEFAKVLKPKNEYKNSAQALPSGDALVVLDLTITPELELEGLARDFVRMVQEARKTAGLQVSNRIALQVQTTGKPADAITAHKQYIADQVLATSLELTEVTAKHRFEQELEGVKVVFGFQMIG